MSAREHRDRLLAWLRTAVAEGWIPEEEIESLLSLESRGAERLFEPTARPLTVGLFGGTGVGKSSLLNRLVGEPVARVGLERPTSTEVTVYAHEDFPVRDLEGDLPMDRVKVLTHGRDEYRDVVWVDMPDIDSVEAGNRELVFEWLPYIDWLVYVVSPEKYRDDAGWRVLARRGHRHHWLFVINRWDGGTAAQHDDFKQLLGEAGFAEPVVLRTSCTAGMDDDFDAIAGTIDRAVEEHGLARLQEVGERARLADLSGACDRYAAMLGDRERWRSFVRAGRSAMDDKLAALDRYLVDEAALQAGGISERPASAEHAAVEPTVPGLVDDYVVDLRAAVKVLAEDLPAAPVDARTTQVVERIAGRAATVLRDAFRQGTARPGNALQRALAAGLEKLVYGLPLATGAGIAYVVVTRYGEGLSGNAAFLGFDFLVHSLVLLALAALLPYLLARLLRPSVRRSIISRVRRGLEALRSETPEEWQAAMETLQQRRNALAGELEELRRRIDSQAG